MTWTKSIAERTDHGRVEVRRYQLAKDISTLPKPEKQRTNAVTT